MNPVDNTGGQDTQINPEPTLSPINNDNTVQVPAPPMQPETPLVTAEPPASSDGTNAQPLPTTQSINQVSVDPKPPVVLPSNDAPLASFAPVVNGQSIPTQPPTKTSKFRKFNKKMIFGAVGLFLLLGTGSVFAFYVPNTPNNVWKTGFDRSGKALDTLTQDIGDKQTLEAFSRTEMNASVKGKFDNFDFDGNADIKFDKTKSNGDISVKASDSSKEAFNVGLKYISDMKEGSKFPDMYFKYTGLSSFGIGFSQIEQYENKWIALESSVFESFIPEYETEKAQNDQYTAEEVASLVKAMNSVNLQYVFTNNKDDAVFNMKSFIGKEKVEGLNTYHYKVGINKPNTKKYCTAMIEKIANEAIYKKIIGSSAEDNDTIKKETINSCNESIDKEISENSQFDMWIDAKYKLIHKVRLTDEKNKNTYFEIGQNYKGGDEISMFALVHDDNSKSDIKFSFNTNIKTKSSSAELTYATSKSDNKDNFQVKMSTKPLNEEIDVTKPEGAISIKDIMADLESSYMNQYPENENYIDALDSDAF